MCGGRSWSARGLTLPIWDAIFITSQLLLLFGKDWSSKVREVGTRMRSGGGFYFLKLFLYFFIASRDFLRLGWGGGFQFQLDFIWVSNYQMLSIFHSFIFLSTFFIYLVFIIN